MASRRDKSVKRPQLAPTGEGAKRSVHVVVDVAACIRWTFVGVALVIGTVASVSDGEPSVPLEPYIKALVK